MHANFSFDMNNLANGYDIAVIKLLNGWYDANVLNLHQPWIDPKVLRPCSANDVSIKRHYKFYGMIKHCRGTDKVRYDKAPFLRFQSTLIQVSHKIHIE